jgi:hypothetical protein
VNTLADDLARARADLVPRMALRGFEGKDPTLMDDVVVERPSMFRMEALDDACYWLCCYFPNGERVTFHAQASLEQAAPGKRRYPVLDVTLTEEPAEWVDLDESR